MIVTNRDPSDPGPSTLPGFPRLRGEPGSSFENLIRIAGRLLKVRGVFVHLAEADSGRGQSTKGRGVDVSWGIEGPPPLAVQSLCRRVMDGAQPVAIEDLRREPSGVDADPRVVAYLGIPLKGPKGCLLGTICAVDEVSRAWTPDEIRDLGDLGAAVMTEVALRRSHEDLTHSEEALRIREDSLKDADRRKDDFMAILGHELRSPLAAVLSAVHLARQAGMDAEELAWSHGVIERQSTQLVRLIDDLLDIARIAQGKVQLRKQHVDLGHVVERSAAAVRPVVERKKHTLVISIEEDPLELEADPMRIEQVLTNLLTNAVKYTDESGRIEVAAARSGDDVVIHVSDNGVGISPDLLPGIFELYSRVSGARDRSHGGLGIGLTLVKMITEMHGGRVEAASGGPARGSRFSLHLPASARRQPARAEARPSPPPPARGARILIVDDNADSADGLSLLLKVEGHDVRTVYSGDVALEAARQHRPDVVILDIGLPGRDGFAVARDLRGDDLCRGAFIVALSGYVLDGSRRRFQEAGFDAQLVKPVDVDRLLKLIDGRRRGENGALPC